MYSLINVCSRFSRNCFESRFGVLWIPCIHLRIFHFLWKIFPKDFWFHSLTISVKAGMVTMMFFEVDQVTKTMFSNSGCDIHIVSNLEIFLKEILLRVEKIVKEDSGPSGS